MYDELLMWIHNHRHTECARIRNPSPLAALYVAYATRGRSGASWLSNSNYLIVYRFDKYTCAMLRHIYVKYKEVKAMTNKPSPYYWMNHQVMPGIWASMHNHRSVLEPDDAWSLLEMESNNDSFILGVFAHYLHYRGYYVFVR